MTREFLFKGTARPQIDYVAELGSANCEQNVICDEVLDLKEERTEIFLPSARPSDEVCHT